MSSKSERIDAVKSVLSAKALVQIELADEKFSTRFLHYYDSLEYIIADQLLPKFGNNLLAKGQTYVLSSGDYDAGIIKLLEFNCVYMKPTEFENLPAQIFSLPVKVARKNEYFNFKTKPTDQIHLVIKTKLSKIRERVSQINIRNLYFTSDDIKQDLPREGLSVPNAVLKLPGEAIMLSGTLHQDTKYGYRIEMDNVSAEDFLILSKFIEVRYCEMTGIGASLRKETSTVQKIRVIRKPVETFKGSVFIVDDEVLLTDLISRALTQKGYQCFAYNDARGIVEKAADLQPDVILLDINMPFLDGLTTLRRLKKNPDTAPIPVIMLTSSREKDDVIDAKDMGAENYIIKSVDMDFFSLADRIDAVLKKT